MLLHADGSAPRKGETFVFGSNLAGRHGAGAARHALEQCDAAWGIGVGKTGRSYAIPTKDARIQTLDLFQINEFVCDFVDYVKSNPNEKFFITRIGCGLAGYTDADIAPMFHQIAENINCTFPVEWAPYLQQAMREMT